MSHKYLESVRALAFISVLVGVSSSSNARVLTFEERVRAQEAIARVYYAHTLSVTKPFEEVYPRAGLEKQVLDSLRRSAALEVLWNTPVTAEALRAETQRIARGTRNPERLEELYAAVGHDAFVFEECVARATLTDRLARSFFAADLRAAAADGSRPTWDAWWRSVEPTFDAFRVTAAATDSTLPQAGDATCLPGDAWNPGALESAPDDRGTARALWTGSLMLIWGGSSSQAGIRYDPLTDSWTGITSINAPTARSNQVMVWTGSRMIVWGGDNGSTGFTSGGIYDPGTDSWTATSTVNAPISGNIYTGVWTGSVMVVWGTNDPGRSGRYDPGTDSWSAVATAGAPQGGSGHTAVWTGTRMIVWGGAWGGGRTNAGGSYDPVGNTWTSISSTGAPTARDSHTAVWTGTDMIVWGGYDGTSTLSTGGRYQPAADAWQPFNNTGAPARRYRHTAVWSGSEMIVWGGMDYPASPTYGDGGRYNLASNAWTAIPPAGAPTPRSQHVAVWDGARMIVYGGRDAQSYFLGDGARYVPSSNSWTPVSLGPAPSTRYGHTAVWTGTEMIVWGGYLSKSTTTQLNTGSRYDPTLDQWTPCSVAGAPTPRSEHGAVWTGLEMVVWGGSTSGGYVNTGGRYRPSTDSWTPTSTSGAPPSRTDFTALWTGKEMLVWGGEDASGKPSAGSRYNPATDSWTPTSASGAPPGRFRHAAVWTGSEMIVWGGQTGDTTYVGDGGRYSPSTDSWQPLPSSSAPVARGEMASAWSGRVLVVWGGYHWVNTPPSPHTEALNTGGRFDPESNTWTPTTTSNAPPPCSTSNFAWVGRELMVWGCTSDGSAQFYDPVADAWRTTTGNGAPTPTRSTGTLVSTSDFAIQWDGNQNRNGSLLSLDSDADGMPNACDSDDDNDGVLDASDCAPFDATASAAATEVDGVLLTKSTSTRLDWTGQASTRYDVAGGSIADLAVDGGVANAACLMNDVTDTSWSDTRPDPAPGTGYYYLVQAENVCGDGGWGGASSGAPRQPRAACP